MSRPVAASRAPTPAHVLGLAADLPPHSGGRLPHGEPPTGG